MRNLLVLLLIVLVGCKETYEVPNHTPGVIKIVNGLVMAAYGEGGLVISNESTGQFISQIFPPQGMNSIDDFDVDGNLIFVLDSRGRDYLAVFSFDGSEVELVREPETVQGGPFNGISAVSGNLVVSGGTTFLNRFTYSQNGDIQGPVSFGRDRGHPDVLLSPDGQAAFISTDFDGGVNGFGVTSLHIGNDLSIPFIISELRIMEAGFSPGVTSPVGFPIQTTVFNDNLIVAHGGGLTIINLTEGYAFNSNSNVDIGIAAITVSIDANIAYVLGYQGDAPALVRLDLSDINNPNIISTETLQTNESIPTSIAVGLNELYIAAGNEGIIQLPK